MFYLERDHNVQANPMRGEHSGTNAHVQYCGSVSTERGFQVEVHRTGKFPAGQPDRTTDCFQNWAMSMTDSKKSLLQKSGENLFYFFFNIKMPETFDCRRDMNVQKCTGQ